MLRKANIESKKIQQNKRVSHCKIDATSSSRNQRERGRRFILIRFEWCICMWTVRTMYIHRAQQTDFQLYIRRDLRTLTDQRVMAWLQPSTKII